MNNKEKFLKLVSEKDNSTRISIKERVKTIPLEIRLKVSNEMAFIILLTELGYRENKSWTPDEDHILSKLCRFATKHTKSQLKDIKKWEIDSKISCKSVYEKLLKSKKSGDIMFPIPQALGFKDNHEAQMKLIYGKHDVRHLIHFGDIETVVKVLFENGYDIIKINNK